MESIEHLENLSKLKFSDKEREKFADEFETILGFVNKIAEADIPEGFDKDEAMDFCDLREDEPKPSMPREMVLQNAPKQKDGCYSTPLVVE